MFAELNSPTSHQQAGRRLNAVPDEGAPCYFDVDGDGFCTPLDALLVINHLNVQAGGAEGEASVVILTAQQPPSLAEVRVIPTTELPISVESPAEPQVGNDLLTGVEQAGDALFWDDFDTTDIQPTNADLESAIAELLP
jgi:hypothetical protein